MPDHTVAQLIQSLSKSQRNHLRIILSRETGCSSLKAELGIQKVKVFSHHTEMTGHAMRGTTAELFSAQARADDIRVTR
jgi:hypothetical protein